MRPLYYYLLVIGSVAFIGMFFVSQCSKHVQMGYELTRLRRERSALLERGRKLEFHISKATEPKALAERARKFGLSLEGPLSTGPTD